MSLHEYYGAVKLSNDDTAFYALIMAAMLRADTKNSLRLAEAFPETFAELTLRYNSPGGHLKDDCQCKADDGNPLNKCDECPR